MIRKLLVVFAMAMALSPIGAPAAGIPSDAQGETGVWFAETAATAAASPHGEWVNAKAEAGCIVTDTNMCLFAANEPSDGNLVTLDYKGITFEDAGVRADVPATASSAILVETDGLDSLHFALYANGSWTVVPTEVAAPDLAKAYDVRVVIDTYQDTVRYELHDGGVVTLLGELEGGFLPTELFRDFGFTGTGSLVEFNGTYHDGAVALAGGEKFGTLDAAFVANEEVTLLADATFEPTDMRETYRVVKNGHQLQLSLPAGWLSKEEEGVVTVYAEVRSIKAVVTGAEGEEGKGPFSCSIEITRPDGGAGCTTLWAETEGDYTLAAAPEYNVTGVYTNFVRVSAEGRAEFYGTGVVTVVERAAEDVLPAGFTRIEYIQGDGSTSDVVTDFIPNPQTDKVVFELERTDLSHNMFAFSARRGTQNASWSVNLMKGGGYRFDYYNGQYAAAVQGVEKEGDRYTYEVDRNVATRSDGGTAEAAQVASFTQAGGALHLFCTPGNATSVGNFRLYSFRVYRDNALVHDLVPAKDPQGKPVLVDVVGTMSITMNGTFYAPSAESGGEDEGDEDEDGEGGVEDDLTDEIMAIINQVNPVVSGRRKFISLAYITDTHKCKRTAGDTDPVNPVTDYWYHDEGGTPQLVDPEPSIRLLGKVAASASFDGLIHTGDFSTAVPLKPFDEGDYLNEIRNVKTMVSTHLPNTPFFAVDGNHDRNYWNGDHTSGHSMTDAEWAAALTEINTDVSGGSEIIRTDGTGNSYTLDFKRCLASGGKNVRLVMVSIYDKDDGSNPQARMNAGLVFGSGAINANNTVVGVTAHDYNDKFTAAARSYLDENFKAGNTGAAFFGSITGHRHQAATERITGMQADHVVVKNAFAPFGDETRSAYHFSIFVFDTERNKMVEIRLAGGASNAPQTIEHEMEVKNEWERLAEHELLALGGNGSSYFITDFVPNPQTDKFVVTLDLPDIKDAQYVFSARQAQGKKDYSLVLARDGHLFEYDGKGPGAPTGDLKASVKYTFAAENNVLTWDGGEGSVAEGDESFSAAGGPLYLFGANGAAADTVGTFRLYSFKIYRNGELIHNLQPYWTEETGATLVDKVEGGDPITLTRRGSGAFVPVEDPRPPSGAKRLEWIQGDGNGAYFATDFVPDPTRDKMEVVVTPTNVDAGYDQFVFGARSGNASTVTSAWALQLRGSTQFRYDFNKVSGTTRNCKLEKDVKYTFTAEANTLTWSHGEGITSTEEIFSPASGPLKILYAEKATTYTTCKLHSFRIWRDGELIHEFLPTRLPSGVLNLVDYGPDPIPVTRNGLFQAGPELPPKSGLIILFRGR